MLTAAAPIQLPDLTVLAHVLQLIETGQLEDGPAFWFDPRTCILLTIQVGRGIVFHWNLESCRDEAEATKRRLAYTTRSLQLMKSLRPDLNH